MNVSEAFDELRKRLEITDEEQSFASKKHQEIRAHLRDHFEHVEDFLTGSYARHTKTKPLRDVDIFFVLPTSGKSRYTPSSVLETFRSVLASEYGSDRVPSRRRSVKVEFGKDTPVSSFDVVPAFPRSGGGYEIPDTKLNSWIATDPTAHADLGTAKNKDLNDNWKPLVKMIKGANREAGEPAKPSFLLEVMALKLVIPRFGGFPLELQSFFHTASDEIHSEWPDPADLGPPVNDEMSTDDKTAASSFLKKAALIAEEARRLEDDSDYSNALWKWRELFGSYMPAP
jgi:hypothetical protein